MSAGKWQKTRKPVVVRFGEKVKAKKIRGCMTLYTERPLFSRRTATEYRQTIKGRLKHMRKLCNLSQSQAARTAGVARSTWQAWENPARDALPDAAQLAAVADAARIEPAAALEWLLFDQQTAATIGGGLRIDANGF